MFALTPEILVNPGLRQILFNNKMCTDGPLALGRALPSCAVWLLNEKRHACAESTD